MRKIWLFCGMFLILTLFSCQDFEQKTDLTVQSSFDTTESSVMTEFGVVVDAICEYILNTNTKKFHKPHCYTVEWIKDTNRQDFCGRREDILALGYDACGLCTP